MGHLGTGLAQPKPQLPKQPLALAHAQLDPVTLPQVLGQELAVPQVIRVPELARRAAKLARHALPLASIEQAWPARPLALAQALKALRLKTLYPALHGARVLIKQRRHRPTTLALSHQQQSVQPVVVARLLRARDLLANCHLHHLGVPNLELAHRRPPKRIRHDDTRLMRVIYVAMF